MLTVPFSVTMKARGKIKLTIYLLGFAGAALFTVLLVRQGVMSVGAAIRTADWAIAGIAKNNDRTSTNKVLKFDFKIYGSPFEILDGLQNCVFRRP